MNHFVFHMHFISAVLLIVMACLAGLIDTIAGGGSLITVPLLLAMGLPPVFALGTSKFQSCIGELNACYHFFKSKRLDIKKIAYGIFFVAVGSIFGTVLIEFIHSTIARNIIPWLLLVVLIYTYFSPKLKLKSDLQKIPTHLFFIIFGLTIGFYNGFLGPGTGALWVCVLMFFLGFDLIKSSLHAKPLNMTGSFFSLILFSMGHHVFYIIGLMMAAGQLIGSRIGAQLILINGAPIVRPIYLSIVTIMVFILFYKMIF